MIVIYKLFSAYRERHYHELHSNKITSHYDFITIAQGTGYTDFFVQNYHFVQNKVSTCLDSLHQ